MNWYQRFLTWVVVIIYNFKSSLAKIPDVAALLYTSSSDLDRSSLFVFYVASVLQSMDYSVVFFISNTRSCQSLDCLQRAAQTCNIKLLSGKTLVEVFDESIPSNPVKSNEYKVFVAFGDKKFPDYHASGTVSAL